MCDPNALTQRYLTVLNDDLGWDAAEDTGGIIVRSTVGGGRLSIWIDNNAPRDPEYFRMHTGFPLPGYEDPADRTPCIEPPALNALAARLSRKLKGAKVTIDDGLIIFSVEMLLAGPDCMPKAEHLVAVLPRARQMLLGAVKQFSEEYALLGIESATNASENS